MDPLVRVSTVTDFLAAPRGASIAQGAFLYFRLPSELTGYVIWQDPGEDDLVALGQLIDAGIARDRHPSLIDGRELPAPPVRLFEFLSGFIPPRRERLAQAVERMALVRAPDLSGAAALGYIQLTGVPYPVQAFEDLAPALAWLEQAGAAELATGIEAHVAEARRVPPLLYAIRRQIEAAGRSPDVGQIARRLALSERTLMRRLADHGTTFGDEVARARVAGAERLLRDTDAPIAEIARRVGCASVSALSVLFRKWTGTTPTDYRHTHRGG